MNLKSTLLTFVFLFTFLQLALSQDKEENYNLFEKNGGYARNQSLAAGGFARFTLNPYLIDPFFITINPAWQHNYSDFFMIDIGSAQAKIDSGFGQFGYFNLRLTPEMTVGLILSRNDFMGSSIAKIQTYSVVNEINNDGYYYYKIENPKNNYELIFTYDMGLLTFGAGISYASYSQEININQLQYIGTPPTPNFGLDVIKLGSSQFGFNLGVLSDTKQKFFFDAAFSLLFPSASIEVNDFTTVPLLPDLKPQIKTLTSTWDATQTIMQINARGFYKYLPKLNFVSFANFNSESGSFERKLPKIKAGTITDSLYKEDFVSFSNLDFGLGINYTTKNFLLVGGVSFSTGSFTIAKQDSIPEYSASYFIFPRFNIGAEWLVTDWMKARIGYFSSKGSVSFEDPHYLFNKFFLDKYDFTFYDTDGVTLGLSFKFGNFTLDATVNDDIIRQGLKLIGGPNSTFAYVTTSYAL